MTAALRWEPVDSPTADLLTALASPHPVLVTEPSDLFLDACRRDAADHGGLVSVNRVRRLLADADIEHHRFSALWSHHTGRGRPMVKATAADGTPMWETCAGSGSGNDGRPYALRRWTR